MKISKRSSGTEMTPSSWREKEETINYLIYEGEILLIFKHIHDDCAFIELKSESPVTVFFQISIYPWNFFQNESYVKLQWGPESWLLCIISCLFPSGPQVILWNPRIIWNVVCENHCSGSTNSYYRWGNSRRSYLMLAQCCINRPTGLQWKC